MGSETKLAIRSRLFAFGIQSGTVVHELERAIFASGKDLKECSEEEPVRRLNIWWGMTGHVLTEVDFKSQTTAGEVKHDIYLKTKIPIAQQQLFGFGSSNVIQDDVLVDTVPQLEGCEGWQIIVDGSEDAAAVRASCWVDCQDEEEQADLVKKVIGDGSSEHSEGAHQNQDQHSRAGGGRGRTRGKEQSKGGGGKGRGSGAGPGNVGDGFRRQGFEARSHYSGDNVNHAKMQRHFVLDRHLQEFEFDVLSRTKPRTKNIWLTTGVSLRLHGPGSGQQEHEQELMLSVSAKRADCDMAQFNDATRLTEELIRSLNEQYRRFCNKAGRAMPEAMGVRSESGYRRGSHRVRSIEQ